MIYGDGEKRGQLRELVSEMELDERILLPGSTAYVADAIYKTRVFVLSSNTEGMPNTLIEAMVMGLTVVSTDCPCGGPAELIQNNYNGILVPVGDVNKMQEKLQFLLNNLQEADRMGINAMKTSDIYMPEKVYEEWQNCLENLMKRK